jgi:DtxR family transcriptional regulator, Mn-dependent transcriptional regulator
MNISIEDYLKNIYSIKLAVGKVTTTLLAEKLNISPAAVSDMISKLSKSGYIKNTPYKGFELTKKGETVAINLIRKHRIWEVFLLKYLNYPWDKIHHEAELLEHASSDELISRLEDFLGFPKYDPHGYPIPNKNGKIIFEKTISLQELNTGEKGIIKKVSDESSEALNYLAKNGLKLNEEIKVLEKISFDNSLQVKHQNNKIFISEKLSKNIFVSRK